VRNADEVLALALERPPRFGDGRLICLDGPSGSGKSALARQIARVGQASVIHTDDLCPGWDGIPETTAIISALLTPLAAGRAGSYPRYDWIAGQVAETVVVQPVPLLILEGVGAGARPWSAWTAALVWVDAAQDVRQDRAFARDGEYFREYWASWALAEEAFFADEDVRARADLVLDTTP
jgi:uridine kinase